MRYFLVFPHSVFPVALVSRYRLRSHKSILPVHKDEMVIDSGVLKTKPCICSKPGSGTNTELDNSPVVMLGIDGDILSEIVEIPVFIEEKYHHKDSSKPGENNAILSNTLNPDCEIHQ